MSKHKIAMIMQRLEDEGWITRTGKGSIHSYVMTPAGVAYVENNHKSLIDKLTSAASSGWPGILAVIVEHVLKTNNKDSSEP